MSRASLAALRQTLTVTWPQGDEAAARELLVRVARESTARIVKEQAGRAGVQPAVETYANQVGNKALETVKLPGPIVSAFDYRREIAKVALEELRKASPVDSGAYRDSHMLYLNGGEIDQLPMILGPGDDIAITNPVPYARRIEVGKTKSGRAFVLKVEPNVYERTLKRIILPKYRNAANLTFGYLTLPSGHIVKGKLSSHYGTGKAPGPRGGGTMRKRRQRRGEPVRAPAIFIEAPPL